MRITKINISKSAINNGLESVKMDKLGQVILLAGKNGAGKTRLLNLINETLKLKPKASQIANIDQQIIGYRNNIKSLGVLINNCENQIEKLSQTNTSKDNQSEINRLKSEIENRVHTVNVYKEKIENLHINRSWDMIETNESFEDQVIIPFVPKNLDIKDCNNFRINQISDYSRQTEYLGMNSLANGTFSRIKITQDRWFNATHQNSNLSEREKIQAITDYDKLKDIIKVFLNTDLKRDIDGNPTLFDFPLGKSNLSDGQKVLIQLCIAIHSQKASLDDIILFLDEPENHLHPSAIIEIIERIKSNNPNGQIWIATHSIPLLSYFSPSDIWYLDNNKVTYAGAIPEKVLNSLLGDENRISKLQDFINLPGIFALNRHAFESLFHPVSVKTGKSDPQILQIQDEIIKHIANKDRIRIIDYGAGKGRLLSTILENNPEDNSKLSKWFDYIAYDKFDTDKEDCTTILQKIYKDWSKRYFNNFSDIFCTYDKESFDIVVMCNVLHEIEPSNWLDLFSKGGEIPKLLNKKGCLLIVEDQEMPIGEKAYQKGFLVLNTADLKELFQITESDGAFNYSDAREDGRLMAHTISKSYITRITADSRVCCLEQIHKTAKEKILSIRDGEINYNNGKRHGFWIQQYANSGLILDEFNK